MTRNIDVHAGANSLDEPQAKIGERKFVILENRLVEREGSEPRFEISRAEFEVKSGYITGPEVRSQKKWEKV